VAAVLQAARDTNIGGGGLEIEKSLTRISQIILMQSQATKSRGDG
jgi:hypothetical protein